MQLSEFFLVGGYLVAETVEDDESGTGGALVDGSYVAILEIFAGIWLLVWG